jgi:hypothetical protein
MPVRQHSCGAGTVTGGTLLQAEATSAGGRRQRNAKKRKHSQTLSHFQLVLVTALNSSYSLLQPSGKVTRRHACSSPRAHMTTKHTPHILEKTQS